MASIFNNYFKTDEEGGLRSGGGGAGGNAMGLEETCAMLSLSRTQRLYGFAICFTVGFILGILGSIFLFFGDVVPFAILYTFGNLSSLFSTGFLIGPVRQCKNMFDPVRLIASLIFFGAMIVTLFLAFFLGQAGAGACLVLVFVQWIALIWYSASYIPFARAAIKNCLGSLVG
ncbi:hypothetical protein MIR68_004760 [Amoeboaphelidium protococcarum]|nr:hypothetical protein MIR68_004760 [Amoeboaphelidium protococcarum]KAI3647753.1 hypothetical protein MP228_007974 [Amoeboaphelidium protococcarum]KAI3653452.1 hypothetical protein MP228_001399 [Amoeboaphelidium protococcarum]